MEAARQLARRTDPPALKTATHITLVAGELEAAKDYGSRYIQQCMLNHDWYAAAEVIHWHEAFKVKDWICIDGLAQDCSNSIANTLELLQSCTNPST